MSRSYDRTVRVWNVENMIVERVEHARRWGEMRYLYLSIERVGKTWFRVDNSVISYCDNAHNFILATLDSTIF